MLCSPGLPQTLYVAETGLEQPILLNFYLLNAVVTTGMHQHIQLCILNGRGNLTCRAERFGIMTYPSPCYDIIYKTLTDFAKGVSNSTGVLLDGSACQRIRM